MILFLLFSCSLQKLNFKHKGKEEQKLAHKFVKEKNLDNILTIFKKNKEDLLGENEAGLNCYEQSSKR